jgi:hypothetical protein
MPPESFANSLNMGHLHPACAEVVQGAKIGRMRRKRKRRFFKRALNKIEHEP